jgi:membrane protease subunit HflC
MARGLIVLIAVVAVVLLFASTFSVSEAEQVILTQFGKPVGGPVTEAGLHFKLPFVQDARRFDKRVLVWEGEPNSIPTKEKRFLLVDSTARWRVADPLLFLQSLRGDESIAQSRLDDILDNAARTWISSNDLIEAVRTTDRPFAASVVDEAFGAQGVVQSIRVGRDRIVQGILDQARPQVAELGIEIVDFRFRRIEYDISTRKSVYERMISEREEVAERYRSEGRARAAEIEGEKDKELRRIESEAARRAEIIRGEADAEAARIYAEAYGADPEFYAFWQSLETYRKALAAGDTTLVLTTGSELLRYVEGAGAAGE